MDIVLSENSISELRNILENADQKNKIIQYFKEKLESDDNRNFSIPYIIELKKIYGNDLILADLLKGCNFSFPAKTPKETEELVKMRNRCHDIIYQRMVENVSPENFYTNDLSQDLQSVRKFSVFMFNQFAVLITGFFFGYFFSQYFTGESAYRVIVGLISCFLITISENYFILKYDGLKI